MINNHGLGRNVTSIQCLDSLNMQESIIVQYFNDASYKKGTVELSVNIANELNVRLILNKDESIFDLLKRAKEVMSQIVEMDLEANKKHQNSIEKYQPYIYMKLRLICKMMRLI